MLRCSKDSSQIRRDCIREDDDQKDLGSLFLPTPFPFFRLLCFVPSLFFIEK